MTQTRKSPAPPIAAKFSGYANKLAAVRFAIADNVATQRLHDYDTDYSRKLLVEFDALLDYRAWLAA